MSTSAADDVKSPLASTSTVTSIKQEPTTSHAAAPEATRTSRATTLTSSASLPIIITPRSLGQHSTSSDDVSGYTGSDLMNAHQQHSVHNPLALSQHIEMMSLNAQQSTSSAPPPYANAHDVMSSMGGAHLSAHAQYLNAMRYEAAMARGAGGSQYDDMQMVAQDMRTNAHYPSPALPQHGMSQLARRRSNVPAPLDNIPLNMVAEQLHSPGPGSCGGSHPATPSHPMTPSHPHQMSHPPTPIVQPQTPIGVPHPRTPSLPYTPSLAQTPAHPVTPHTPSQPCTPSHPAQQTAQHFQVSAPASSPSVVVIALQ